MATLDEIFAAMPDVPTVGTHELLIIDPDLRQIDVPDAERIFGVENDNKAERKYFQCPRYVGDGLDLAACSLRVTFTNANDETDAYVVEDLTVSGSVVLFSWELSKKVTLYKGNVRFLVYAGAEDGTDWHTTFATGTVLEGKDIDASDVEEKTSDVITQLLLMVAKQTAAVEAEGAAQIDAVEEAAAAATAEAKAAIEAKGAATLATIPAEYTAMGAQVEHLTRNTAGAIVCAVEGDIIQVHDASDHHLHGLRIFGRSTQDGTPTPDAPAEIVSTPAPVVRVQGKNLVSCHDVQIENDAYYYHTIFTDFEPVIGETYTLSMDIVCSVLPFHINIGCGANAYNADLYPKVSQAYAENGRISISFVWDLTPAQINQGYTKLAIRVPRFATETTFKATISNIMLERGANMTDYMPYMAEQTMALTSVDGLPGIPVASGGNYTDANGQQWICDEVDLARGVYVQRIGQMTLTNDLAYYYNTDTKGKEFFYTAENNNAKAWETRMCCSHFPVIGGNIAMESDYWTQFSGSGGIRFRHKDITSLAALTAWLPENPVSVCYVLADPAETPLTDTDILAFKALRSNKPTTVLLNDSGARMAVGYVADTKLYIDRKIAELVAAITT